MDKYLRIILWPGMYIYYLDRYMDRYFYGQWGLVGTSKWFFPESANA